METGWKRLTEYTNAGLPGAQAKAAADGKTYLKVKPEADDSSATISITLEKKKEEKFVVVIFANHKKYVSDPLVFNNLSKILDSTAIDLFGALSLEHGNTASQDTY
jgi:hypothetical protein